MATKYRLFSRELGSSLQPDLLEPLPQTLVVFDHDPKSGVVINPALGRGGVIRTGGSFVYQDFGLVSGGDTCTITGSVGEGDYLLPDTVEKIIAAESVVNGFWYLTDGVSCWSVRFSRNPRGFHSWYNNVWASLGLVQYSYEMNLILVSKDI